MDGRLCVDAADLGACGERVALEALVGRGLRLVGRRVRTRLGEIDLVLLDGPVVVFAEVKTRSAAGFGRPAESVTRGKRRRLERLATAYLARRGWGDRRCRFDVVEVEPGQGGLVARHIVDAFRAGD
jgi:putative endonuclease